jgi:hypothetical protein
LIKRVASFSGGVRRREEREEEGERGRGGRGRGRGRGGNVDNSSQFCLGITSFMNSDASLSISVEGPAQEGGREEGKVRRSERREGVPWNTCSREDNSNFLLKSMSLSVNSLGLPNP